MIITYKMTWRDRQEGYRIGLSYMTLPYRFVWFSILLLMPIFLMLTLYANGGLTSRPATGLLRHLILIGTFAPFGMVLGVFLVTTILMGYLFRSQTVQILPLHLALKQIRTSNLIRWKNITDVVETGEYICFCQNVPAAVVVPKLAFPNQEQADAFLEQAMHYWRRETGQKDPVPLSTSGVWPPAPCPSNSAEPGDRPKEVR